MPFLRPHRLCRFFLAASIACLSCFAGPAWAWGAPIAFDPVAVVEYYNVTLHHYFLTAHADEMAAIDAGSAGPGWTRTGWTFSGYPVGSGQSASGMFFCPGGCGVPVSRFYSAYSNSHFHTADPAEAAGIQQPGSEWMLERQEFQIGVPDAAGQCAAGLVPIKSYRIAIDLDRKILPSAVREDETANLGPCMALNNLPAPTTLYPIVYPQVPPAGFFGNEVYGDGEIGVNLDGFALELLRR